MELRKYVVSQYAELLGLEESDTIPRNLEIGTNNWATKLSLKLGCLSGRFLGCFAKPVKSLLLGLLFFCELFLLLLELIEVLLHFSILALELKSS